MDPNQTKPSLDPNQLGLAGWLHESLYAIKLYQGRYMDPFPPIANSYCSYLCRMNNLGNNLLTQVSKFKSLLNLKFSCASVHDV